MKCIIAAFVIAFAAVAAEASWGPWGTVVQANVPSWPAAHWDGAWSGTGAWPVAAHWTSGAWPAAAHWGVPAASVAHHAGIVPGAVSVNANRGAVHVAPLAGHAISQKQLNLAPAPGTI
ncbi:adult cuticle protein 1-like [Toxorhynchites rutilus septentrionalis]|uniref:adult cuticle protein 1-like n=1 Tax=Toxorhynchites rutilus septentrionalis TaxID=329112 RepID=UPI0024789279|nr:adult cuticle protein 1-like [Toxorhynchites rutilus septentrionalis]